MSDLVAVDRSPHLPVADRVALDEDMPSIEDLFLFAREAELRVRTLRMIIEERSMTARGEELLRHEIQLQHPGKARVTTRHGDEDSLTDYDVWLLDGDTVTIYRPASKAATRRPRQGAVVGVGDPGLPVWARQREPLTALPSGSLADAFVHPHGLFRNVLVTGPLAVVGTQSVAGREAIVVRSEHPRAAEVLVDRPDRSLVVGIGRETGFLLLLIERIGRSVTRYAQVTDLQLDPIIPPSAFELHLAADVRKLY